MATMSNHFAGSIAEVQQAGEIEQIDKSLNASLAEIHSLTSITRDLSDRLLGSQPEAVRGKSDQPACNSQLGKLHEVAGYIRVSVDELRSQIARLERL